MERWLILVWSFLFALLGEAQVRVSAWPEGKDGLERSPDYDVTVKSLAGGSGEWIRVPNLRCDVDTRHVRHASFAEFEMGSPVVVRVKNCRTDAWDGNGKMQVKVKPSSRGIACRQVDARTV